MTKRGALLLILLGAGAAPAGAEGFGLAFKAGSTGLGAELTAGLTGTLNLRVGAGGFGYSYDRTVSGIDYDTEAHLSSGSALLDWHPGGGAFRLSGGLMLQGNKATGQAVPRGTVTIGDTTYPANAVGDITAEVDFPRTLAPVVMLGFGNGARGGRLFFSLDAGLAFSGSPAVTVAASRATPGLQADLEAEARDIEDEIDWLKTYPVVALGIGIRF